MIFENARLVYEGTPDEYTKYIRQVFFRFAPHFENVWKWLGHLKKNRISNTKWLISIGGFGIVHPGEDIDNHFFPLRFKDNSIFTVAQTIIYDKGVCWINDSVIRFIKINTVQNKIEYIFHYDSVIDIPNHPDHHLQFEYNRDIQTPRFPIDSYQDIESILEMIVRDEILDS